jgi:hypothetical protein
MKPRDFLNFFKTKTGKLLAFAVIFAAGLIIFSVLRKHQTSAEDGISVAILNTNVTDKPQVVQSVTRPMQLFSPPPPRPSLGSASQSFPVTSSGVVNSPTKSLPTSPTLAASPDVTSRPNQVLAPISLFADSRAGVALPKRLSETYAPFGRLIPCETVITVDSSSMRTPIVGLITENVYYGGKLIIPAGTEIHGSAQIGQQRDRIATGTGWTLVWQDGEEMQLKALALDREFDDDTNQSGWAITDGSAGLRGEVIKSDNLADIKLFAATFLSGAASALTAQQQTVFGPINSPTLNNAPFQGAQAVLQTYAQQIYDSIQKNGFYIRVPSGKQFYLYVLQTIDRSDATFGGIGLVEVKDEQPAITPKSKP